MKMWCYTPSPSRQHQVRDVVGLQAAVWSTKQGKNTSSSFHQHWRTSSSVICSELAERKCDPGPTICWRQRSGQNWSSWRSHGQKAGTPTWKRSKATEFYRKPQELWYRDNGGRSSRSMSPKPGIFWSLAEGGLFTKRLESICRQQRSRVEVSGLLESAFLWG